MEIKNQILQGSVFDRIKDIEDESIDCIITSPPYWALRDYKVEGQVGTEKTIDEYVDKLIAIFDECKRVLKKEGTCWVVLGDTYAGGNGNTSDYNRGPNSCIPTSTKLTAPSGKPVSSKVKGIQNKSLCMIPERFAIKMINNGWILRSKIIWHKRNCMPSSAKDRFTIDYEYIYFFTKNKKYYFKTQYEPYNGNESGWRKTGIKFGGNKAKGYGNPVYSGNEWIPNGYGRIKRCVWTINTAQFKDAHFAVFPENLVEQCLNAGCPEEGICLDPFMGAGTTALVALKTNRNFVGIELNKNYIDISMKRIEKYLNQTKINIYNGI